MRQNPEKTLEEDPVVRLRRIRNASAKRFPTTRELADYLSAKWSQMGETAETHETAMTPLEEIHAIKNGISQKFKTSAAYGEYLRKKYPGANPAPESPCAGRTVAKSGKRPAARRRGVAVQA